MLLLKGAMILIRLLLDLIHVIKFIWVGKPVQILRLKRHLSLKLSFSFLLSLSDTVLDHLQGIHIPHSSWVLLILVITRPSI
jgi:hypothetical protein